MRHALVFCIAATVLVSTVSSRAERFMLVKYTTLKNETGHAAMTQQEYNDAMKWIRAEAAVFVRAQRAAKKAWDDENPGKSYTGKSLKARTMKSVKVYSSKVLAAEKVQELEGKKKKWEEIKSRGNVVEDRNTSGMSHEEKRFFKRAMEEERKELAEAQARQERKADKRESELSSAQPYVEKAIIELVNKMHGMKDLKSPDF